MFNNPEEHNARTSYFGMFAMTVACLPQFHHSAVLSTGHLQRYRYKLRHARVLKLGKLSSQLSRTAVVQAATPTTEQQFRELGEILDDYKRAPLSLVSVVSVQTI